MDINIQDKPPDNIPQIRRKYQRASLICLALTLCALAVGAVTLFYDTRYDRVLEYTAFSGFITAGFIFVYFTEKLMGYRRLGIRQRKELLALAEKHREIGEYCQKVTIQGRYIVVNEYDSIIAHAEKIKNRTPDSGTGSS